MKGTTRLDAKKSSNAANTPVRQNKPATNVASFADNSARTSNQLQLMNAIHGSASTANQAAQLQRMFGATAQLEGEDELQMKTETAQLAGPEDEVQMKAETAQLEGEDELQMKAETAQLAGPEDEVQMKAETAQLEGEDELQMKAETAQLAGPEDEVQMKAETAQLAGPEDEVQMKGEAGGSASSSSSNGGLPASLRAGIEATSGMDMSDVQVHSNSAKPKELNALAYTQGNEIHVGPGQERHLPHEAWHVVQQRQGRVSPTIQTKEGVPINDDASLESEADVMGARAAQAKADPNRM